MERLGGYFIIYAFMFVAEILGAKSGINFDTSRLVHNDTKSFGKHSAHNYRTKRQGNQYPDIFHHDFVNKHVRRGNCYFVFDDPEEKLRRFDEELDNTVQLWQPFANNGHRNKNSFILHPNLDNYETIARVLRDAILLKRNDRTKMNIPARFLHQSYWYIILPAEVLVGLKIAKINDIVWREENGRYNLFSTGRCTCGHVGIELGFYFNDLNGEADDNDIEILINHFQSQDNDEENEMLCW